MINKLKKKLHLLIPLVLIIGVIYTWFALTGQPTYIGLVEPLIVPNISEVSGKIVHANVSLGQSVQKGEVIAVIDDTDQQYALSQLEFSLEKRKVALGEAAVDQGGQAANLYLAAKEAWNSARDLATKALTDYNHAQVLYAEGAIPENELEKAKVNASSAAAASAAALAQLNNAGSGSGQTSSQLDISILENQIAQTRNTLEKYTLTAPCNGTIISSNYREGSVVIPGANIADIGSSSEMYVVFYLPEDQLAKVKYNSKVQLEYAGEVFFGVIKFIDVKSAYTPRDLQTEANKSKTSFKVKVLLSKESKLKPGLEVKVTLSN